MRFLENQHWVPRFLLKNFADDDGRVFRLSLADDKITKLSPRQAASRSNFYELLVAGEPKSFEKRFEVFETAAAPAVANIIKFQSLSVLSSKQRRAVADFIAVQSFRTEAYRIGLGLGPR